jgi:hypothetical protein
MFKLLLVFSEDLEAVHTDDGGDDTSCDCERDKYDISEAG